MGPAAAAAGPIGAITVQGDMASGGPGTGKHHGPIYRVQRNPSLPAVYLTAGDWSVRLWTEKIRGPVIVTPYAPAYITAAAWSPTRPGVFFAARSDGVLDVWDLAYRCVAVGGRGPALAYMGSPHLQCLCRGQAARK
jgi:WD40 repeat protein